MFKKRRISHTVSGDDLHESIGVRLRRDVAVFGNLRVLCFAAMLCAMSVVLGYVAKLIFGTAPYRITFENLPIIFGGISFGPLVGAMIAVAADLCSCLFASQGPNPLILVGSFSVGLVSGFVGGICAAADGICRSSRWSFALTWWAPWCRKRWRCISTTATSHCCCCPASPSTF